jgi:predicted SAM-dependent methyltransferase
MDAVKINLNLGCHIWKLDGFVNIDIDPNVDPDLVADVRSLPFENESIDFIYAGHILEHCSYDSDILVEWKRVLKNGGEIIVTVPDTRKALYLFDKKLIDNKLLNQIIFGDINVAGEHSQAFTSKILLDGMNKHFRFVQELKKCQYTVCDVPWQTIAKGIK